MMGFSMARLVDNQALGEGYYLLRLSGCAHLGPSRPGQFAMLRGDWGRDPVLPRAYSILWIAGEEAEFLVRSVGRGSGLLATMQPGQEVAVVGPLGSSFPSPEEGTKDLFVAGGCGIAPLYLGARRAVERGEEKKVELLYGVRQKEDLVLLDRLRQAGVTVYPVAEDGSAGWHGLVTDLLTEWLDEWYYNLRFSSTFKGPPRVRVFSCGPENMLREVREIAKHFQVKSYLSLEAPMACGMGACLGCAVPGRDKPYVYVCQDGPVFAAEEVWP